MKRTRLLVVAVIAGAGVAFVAVRRVGWPIVRFVVEGASMEPAYREDERVLVYRWAYWKREPSAGDVVVLDDPERPEHWIIKRVAFDGGLGEGVYVRGDNAVESRDSRMFGNVAARAIVGRVIMRY